MAEKSDSGGSNSVEIPAHQTAPPEESKQATAQQTEQQKQKSFLNSFSQAASRKQLGLAHTDSQRELGQVNEVSAELETRIVQTKVNTVAGVSEPNFEDDISIDVEDDDQ